MDAVSGAGNRAEYVAGYVVGNGCRNVAGNGMRWARNGT